MKTFKTHVFLLIIILTGCTSDNAVSNQDFQLNHLYFLEYNSIENEHYDTIMDWISEARLNDTPINLYSFTDTREDYGHRYVLAKGYKEIEVLFIYSADTMNSRGDLHIAGTKGEDDDEVFAKIKYDRRYIQGITISDETILKKNKK